MIGKVENAFDFSTDRSTGEDSSSSFSFLFFLPLLLLLLLFSLLTTAKRRTSHEINEHEEETEVSFSNLAKWKARGMELCVII